MYYGVMPVAEKHLPFKLFAKKEHAESWLRMNSLAGWHIREFAHRVPDFVTLRNKDKLKKLF